ncbi:MAG TPA: hypothetical protein VLS25_11420 [Dehalococcoidia bacterium]|nr:hypothetical protein [Dehalococcoidia bacterium]
MRFISDESRARMKLRHEVGCWTGYAGLFTGLMALLATTSEGTPFAMDEKGWVVLGFMVGGYLFGWAIAPLLNRIAGLQ